MRNLSFSNGVRVAVGAAVLAVTFAGCRPAEAPPPAPPVPEVSAPAETSVPAADSPDPAPAPAAAETPPAASRAPSPAQPPVARVPELSSMTLAAASSKLGVPVDLRYSFEESVQAGRPVTLHLAAVPRVAGSNLSVSIKEEPGIQVAVAPFGAQKASAATAYRQQLSVTKLAGGPAELRVLVTMDVAEGSAFSWFGVPFEAAAAAQQK